MIDEKHLFEIGSEWFSFGHAHSITLGGLWYISKHAKNYKKNQKCKVKFFENRFLRVRTNWNFFFGIYNASQNHFCNILH